MFLGISFIYLKERECNKDRESEKQKVEGDFWFVHLLQKAQNSQGWDRLKPGTWSSVTLVLRAQLLELLESPGLYVSRELDQCFVDVSLGWLII